MNQTPHFDIALIDFRVKRLGLTHNPQISSTIEGASVNEISRAIIRWKKSLTKTKKR